MKARRAHQYAAPREVLTLDDVDEPKPVEGGVKIRVSSVTLNFNDLDGITGEVPPRHV